MDIENGKLHKEWYRNGKLHRENGPAIEEDSSIHNKYYIDGQRYNYLYYFCFYWLKKLTKC